MPFLLPQADLPAWPWIGDSSFLSPRCFCWRELGTRIWIAALFLSFIGDWVSTFLLLANSGLWHLMSWSFWISGLAEWCWLQCSPLSILAGMIMVGLAPNPITFILSGSCHCPHRPFIRSLLSKGWPTLWEGEKKLGGWGLEGVMFSLYSLILGLMEITLLWHLETWL